MPRKRKQRTIETDIFGLPVGGSIKINSKKKGDNNERVASYWLEKWTGVPFSRTPSSGGLRFKNASIVCGDVVCQDEDFDFLFVVETKHLKGLTITKNLRSNSGVYKIWEQCSRDATRAGKESMLLLRRNGMKKGEYYVFFDNKVQQHLLDIDVISYGKKGDQELFGYLSSDILKYVTYSGLAKLMKNENSRHG